jgi:uncharacterized membrane protein
VDRRTLIIILVVVAVAAATAGAVIYGRRDKPGTEASYCAAVRAGENPQAILLRAADQANPDDSVAILHQGAARLRDLQEAAPTDIRGKLDTMAHKADVLAKGMADPDADVDLGDTTGDINAGEVVLAYTRQHCGVEWSIPETSDAPSASPPPAPG